MELLTELSKNGVAYLLLAISYALNIALLREVRSLYEKRLTDFKDTIIQSTNQTKSLTDVITAFTNSIKVK